MKGGRRGSPISVHTAHMYMCMYMCTSIYMYMHVHMSYSAHVCNCITHAHTCTCTCMYTNTQHMSIPLSNRVVPITDFTDFLLSVSIPILCR